MTADGLPDLVTALNYNPLWYDPSIGATPTNTAPSRRNRNCPPAELLRDWQEVNGLFPWRVYPNLGNGQFATQPLSRSLPIALDGEGADGFIGKKERDLTLAQHVRDYGIMDMDGDGRLDLVRSTVSNGWFVHQGIANAEWLPPVAWPAPAGARLSASITTWPTTTWSYTNTNEQLEDVNGDGLPDFVRTGPSGIIANFNTGRSFSTTTHTIALLPAEHAPGRTVIQALQGTSGNLQHGRRYVVHRFVDIDGDGLPEFIRNGGGHDLTPWVHPNHGGSFHIGLAGPLVPSADVLFSRAEDDGTWSFDADLLDVTGDGVPDAYQDGSLFTRLASTPRHLLRLVDNGRGGEVRVNYSSSNVSTIGESGGLRRGGPVWVVDAVTKISGSATVPTGVTRYAYHHPVAIADRQGRTGFRGFRKVTVTSPLGARTEHSFKFEQMDPTQGNVLWEGAAEREDLFDSTGAPVRSTSYSYTVLPVLGGATYAVAPELVELMTWIPGAGPGLGPDSPVVRTSTTWAPLTAPGSTVIIAYHESTQLETVENNSPAPLFVEDRRVTREARLIYAADAYTLLTDVERHEQLDDNAWMIASEVKHDYSGILPIAEHVLVQPGIYATAKREFRPSGVVYSTVRPRQVQLGSGLMVLTDYDVFEIHPTRTTDELGGYVHRRFDLGSGVMTVESARTDQTDIGFAPRTEIVHDGVSRPLIVRRTHFDGTTLSLVDVERMTYVDTPDSMEISERRQSFQNNQWSREDSYFDGWGLVVSKVSHTVRGPEASNFSFDAAGNVVKVETLDVRDDSPQTVTFDYSRDSLGRVTTRLVPELAPTVLTYVGMDVTETVTTTDGSLGRQARNFHDPRGRLRRVDELSTAGWATTTYEYDGNDNIHRIINADGAKTVMTHDMLGRRTHVDRDGRIWAFSYDHHGNLELEQGPVPSGAAPLDYANTYTYDDIDRQTSSRPGIGDLSGASPVAVATHGTTVFTYDQSCVGTFGYGRLCQVKLPFGGLNYGYTAEGWLSTERRKFGFNLSGQSLEFDELASYIHDPDGEPHQITHSDYETGNWRIDYFDDVDGLPISVEAGRVGDPFVAIAKLKRGRGNVVRLRQGPADQEQSWKYDALGRIKSMAVSTPSGNVLEQSLAYWQTGNLRTLNSSTLSAPIEYQYDPQYQITNAEGAKTDYVAAFGYSAAGRVTRAKVNSTLPGAQVTPRDVTYEYASPGAPVHRLSSISNGTPLVEMTHDTAGNTTRRTVSGIATDYSYDAFDRLREARTGSRRDVHLYSPDGTRILTLHNDGGWTARHWFGPAETLYAADSSQLEAQMHIGLGAMTVARLSRVPESTPELVYADGLGNTLALLDVAGAATAMFAYGAFGETLVASGPSAAAYHRRFNSEEWDELTGLVYYGFRYYDPLLLQWTQPDPMYRVSPDQDLRNPRMAGLYDFSLNNPLRYVDPNGLEVFGRVMAEMQREMCTASTQHPTICFDGPSPFLNNAWKEQFEDEEGFEPPDVSEPGDRAPEAGGGILGKVGAVLGTAFEVMVPQSKEEAGLMVLGGVAGKVAGTVWTKRKKVSKTLKAVGQHAGKQISKRLAKTNFHHLTPRQFRKVLWKRYKIDVDDFTLEIPTKVHRRVHSARRMARVGKKDWNSAWRDELASGRLQTADDVKRFANKMVTDYGLPQGAVVRYPYASKRRRQ